MPGQYILSEDGTTPIPCDSISEWGAFMQKEGSRIVEQEHLPDGRWLSTVFLGLDHSFSGEYGPILWETMLFSSKGDGKLGGDLDSDRCGGDRSNALEMHARMLAKYSNEH